MAKNSTIGIFYVAFMFELYVIMLYLSSYLYHMLCHCKMYKKTYY